LGEYNTPNLGNSFGDIMNLFRITLTTPAGKHVEDLPFETFDLANAHAQGELKSNMGVYTQVEDLGEAMKLKIEVTDTFGGESNYSWVNRHELWVACGTTSRECVRLAKAKAGWTGTICRTDTHGDSWTLRPSGLCQIMFVNIEE
jgi:hypothetical protein